VWIPKILLIFTLVLTYSTMNPVLLIFGTFYFVSAYIILKYNLSMSWVPALTMGPQTWVVIFDSVRYSYIVAQLTLYGMFLTKKYPPAALLLPLLYFTWNKTKEIKIRFQSMFESATLSSAKHKDARYPPSDDFFERNPYAPPVLVVKYRTSG